MLALLLLAASGSLCSRALSPPRHVHSRVANVGRAVVHAADGSSSSSGEKSELDPAALILLDAVEDWVREQRVSDILPEKKLRSLLKAVRSDVTFWERQHHQYERLWTQIEDHMRLEARPVRVVLGEDLAHDILSLADELDTRPIVRRALQSDVMERLLGSVLYEALFAFVQSVDILGQFVNTLPIIGPMRAQIIQSSKSQLDAILGDQITSFLGGYTASAVGSAVAYVDKHGGEVSQTQKQLVTSFLDMPFNATLPSQLDTAMIRDALWLRLRSFRLPDEDEIVSNIYREFGDETMETLLPVAHPREAQALPRIFVTGRDILTTILNNFISSEQGRRGLQQWRDLDTSGEAPPPAKGGQTTMSAASLPDKVELEKEGGDTSSGAVTSSGGSDDDWD